MLVGHTGERREIALLLVIASQARKRTVTSTCVNTEELLSFKGGHPRVSRCKAIPLALVLRFIL